MSEILQIVLVTVPPVIVLVTAYFVVKSFFENEKKKRNQELILNNQKLITPIRLQAYERIVLFLERISMESLLSRLNKKGLKSHEFQTELLNTIRAEYEHNISQQVYISIKAWDVVKNARGNIIKIINTAADQVDPKSPSLELSKKIIEMTMGMDKTPSVTAIEYLKEEIRTLF